MDSNRIENREETITDDKVDIYYQTIINNLETMIKEDYFKSKEDLNNYLTNIKNRGVSESILSNEKILEYLNLYDEYHKQEETSLNLDNYKGVSLENQNMIVSTQNGQILKTDETPEKLPEEFKQAQNELTVNNTDGLANADEAYNYLKNNKKEEMSFVTISEAINMDNINKEILFKIKFFISNEHINPYSYSVNLDSGIFYNNETKELFEIRKNEQTDTYEIYKGGEQVYNEPATNSEQPQDDKENDYDFEKEIDTPEEKMSYENRNIKVRRLIKPSGDRSAAFVKSTLLTLILGILSVLLSIILLQK